MSARQEAILEWIDKLGAVDADQIPAIAAFAITTVLDTGGAPALRAMARELTGIERDELACAIEDVDAETAGGADA